MSSTYYGRFEREEKPSIQLRIPPNARYARTVRDAIVGFAGLHDVGERDLEALLFAVGEALANAIEHSRTNADIVVRIEVDDQKVTATVTDRGSGMVHLPDEFLPLPDSLAERGRGIPIMQRCVDVFEMARLPDGGTAVTLGRVRRDRTQESHVAS